MRWLPTRNVCAKDLRADCAYTPAPAMSTEKPMHSHMQTSCCLHAKRKAFDAARGQVGWVEPHGPAAHKQTCEQQADFQPKLIQCSTMGPSELPTERAPSGATT